MNREFADVHVPRSPARKSCDGALRSVPAADKERASREIATASRPRSAAAQLTDYRCFLDISDQYNLEPFEE